MSPCRATARSSGPRRAVEGGIESGESPFFFSATACGVHAHGRWGCNQTGHVKANCAKKKKPDGGADAASDGS